MSPGSTAMTDFNIGPVSAFSDPGRKVVEIDGVEIGVFQIKGEFKAYQNICPHLGGPVCQGRLLPRAQENFGDDRKSLGITFSKDEMNIVCPWHGYEYSIHSGRHQGNDKLRLRPVAVRIIDGDVHLEVPGRSRS
jgi:nitrite reductase/ring-hydroxylating ferredoxin subunit